MQKGEVKLRDVSQPLARVGRRARREGQGHSSGIHSTKGESTRRCEEDQERGVGVSGGKGKGGLMREDRLCSVLCFEMPPMEPGTQQMAHYLLNEGKDGGIKSKT